MKVIKRDERQVEFDKDKIKEAVKKAFIEVDGELTTYAKEKSNEIANYIFNLATNEESELSVEKIQDLVEEKLMASNRKDVAKAYIIFRNERTKQRERKSKIVIDAYKRINQTLNEHANANVDEDSFSGREKEASSSMSKTIAFDLGGLSDKTAKAHKEMLIYQHDAEKAIYGEHNCAVGSTWINYRNQDGVCKTMTLDELGNLYSAHEDMVTEVTNGEVLGRDGWTKLENIYKRSLKDGEKVYELQFDIGYLKLTGEHLVPIIRDNEEVLVEVKDIRVGDELYSVKDINIEECKEFECNLKKDKIKNIKVLYPHEYVYDLQTASHWFVANDFVIHNCLNVDIPYCLSHGFSTRNGDVRPAKSVSTGFQQLAVIFQCQSQVQFGGVGSIHIDTDLAPYVKLSFIKHYVIELIKDKDDFMSLQLDKMTEEELDDWVDEHKQTYLKEVELTLDDIYIDNKNKLDSKIYQKAYYELLVEGKQSAQALYHNLNTLESRAGSQVPFTSLNLGRDTTTEGRMITTWLMNASLNGIGEYHKTSIFPITIFQYKKGVNVKPEDPNYDLKQLALKSLSKRIYPNWANGDWSQAHEDLDNPDTYFSTMGCRTLVGYDRHGLGYIRQGRGNNVPNTIILPKLGIEYGICLGKRDKADLDGFWKAFEETLSLCEYTLLERYEIIKSQSPKSAPFMYQNNTMQGADECEDTVENSVKHNTLAIGYIGIAEMCQALFGKNHAEDNDVWLFAQKVQKRIYDFANEASERNDLNFSCYASPSEGLCSTALKALRSQYGVIDKVTSNEFLTNSHHVPVWMKVSIYDKLRLEAPFCKYATGGCITYVEVDSTFVKNIKAVESIIDYAMELDIPYLAINFPIDTCLDCGYQGEMNTECPMCHSTNVEHLARVTGYLSTKVENFNDGKRAEVRLRVKHSAYTNFDEVK